MENYKFVDQIVINLWDWKKHGLLNLILIWNLLKKYGFYILYYIQFTKNNTHINRVAYQLWK